MAWKSLWNGAIGDKSPPVPEKKRGRIEIWTCKSLEQAENHEKGLRGSWARNYMGNPSGNENTFIFLDGLVGCLFCH